MNARRPRENCRHDALSCMANFYIFMSIIYFDQKSMEKGESK